MSDWHRGVTDVPLFGVVLTVVFYALSLRLNRKRPQLHPLFFTAGGMIVFLLLCRIPYADYARGGDIITLFLGPATVALAVPLYKYSRQIRGHLRAVAAGIAFGSICSMLTASILVSLLHGSRDTLVSMMPKSVTSPVAIEIARQIGGTPALAGVFTVLTGLLGSMVGPALLRLAGIRSDLAVGTAIGTAAHGIGTARILRDSEAQGAVSGFAMALSAIVTPLLFIPAGWWI